MKSNRLNAVVEMCTICSYVLMFDFLKLLSLVLRNHPKANVILTPLPCNLFGLLR